MTYYDQVISYIKSVFSSTDLNPSKVAIFEKIANSISPVFDNTNAEIINTENIITNIIALKQPGKSSWYTQQALLFEYDLVNSIGVDLSIDPISNQNIYSNPDTTKQIIKVAVFSEVDMTLKVAFEDTDGKLKALPTSAPDLKTLFDNYFVAVAEWAGLPIIKVSNNPNLLVFVATIVYYPSYDLISLKAGVLAALTSFQLNNQSNDGKFYVNDLSDFIKATVSGIRNMAISDTTLDSVSFDGEVTLLNGYFDYDGDVSTFLTYVSI